YMMTFFPIPYEDELLYSILARYRIHSGNISLKSTSENIYRIKDKIENYDKLKSQLDDIEVLKDIMEEDDIESANSIFIHVTSFFLL
ncbi:MAG: Peptide chain release factor 2, partial [Clostridium butyricum DORA_1]